jgi:putative membrane protein
MFAWTSHGTELKRFSRQPITRIAIAVMLLIPLLYGAMYVWAFWDPTTHLNKLPVALVNADIPSADDDGQVQHYGQDLVDELVTNDDIGWVQVDASTAEAGVNSGKYYFSVTVPADFTTRINSLSGSDPTGAQIDVTYDDTNSFLASTLGKSAMLEVQKAVREKISSQAVGTLLVGVGDARDGFNTASDGAFELSDGLTTAADGSDTLNVGAQQLAAGAAKLSSGSVDLDTGAHSLNSGLKSYVAGVTQAGAGATKLNQGASNLTALVDGLAQAADTTTGAPALAAGIKELASGMTTFISGASSYSSGATSYASGAQSWAAGAEQWRSAAYTATGGSLTDATSSIASGANSVASATASDSDLATGAAAVSSGDTTLASSLGSIDEDYLAKAQTAIDDGDYAAAKSYLQKARSGVQTAKTSATSLASGADDVSDGIAKVHSGATTLATAATSLKSGWDTIHAALASNSTLGQSLTSLTTGAGNLKTAAAQLTTGSQQLADPATTTKVNQLVTGADKLSTAITTMSTAASDTTSGIPALQSGLSELATGFNTQNNGLISGAKALYSGSTTLADGLDSAKSGTSQLSTGASKIAASTPALASGLADAQAGADKLGTKLADGASAIPDDSTSVRTARADAISSPVTLETSHVWQADSWGEGFAPFFIPLALWVGALITWLLLRPLQTRALMTSVNGFRMAWGSLNSALLLSVGQVVIMLTVMHFAIGLNPKNVLATIAFSLLTAAAFFALQQFFQVTLGSAVGKVVIIVLLMVQLASAGGTYPIQTTPDFLQAISPYMPMTYVVNGLREAITGGIETRFWVSVAVLIAIFVVSLAATSIASARKRIWTMSRLHPALSI